jgi:membrane glycosyltransferase
MVPDSTSSPRGQAVQTADSARQGLPAWRRAARFRRLFLAVAVIGQTGIATFYFSRVLPYHGGTLVELGLLFLFALLFAWISVGFWVALTGFVLRLRGGDPHSLLHRHPEAELSSVPLARTAVVMPIYHEPVARTLNGLRACFLSLQRTGQLDSFDFFILSDSRDPQVWLSEREAWHRLCEHLGASGRLFYRHRPVNLHYKSGNVADFLRRWGRAYRYMIVLDADSLMEGTTLVKMVRLMEREPQVGILQTSPAIINAESLFARVQQFSSHVYGPLFTTGLAAYQLGEAAYWGHNAILRIEPFMRHCGLKKLTGPGLFRGAISSHDFVEAAFMGRAGHEVWLEPELTGSYEESPPALAEELTRDRRWAKGNLQHLWVLFTEPRLRFAHRMALFNGVMSYLASPLWFAFLALTTVAAAQMTLLPIDYFPAENSLFPVWPEWNPAWALALVAVTLFLLFLPKLLAVAELTLSRRLAQHGGTARLGISVLIEILVSALLAPIRMLAHTRHVLEAVFNTTLRWAGQNRSDETQWRDALASESPGTLLALSWAGFAWWLDPTFFLWTLPVVLPLVLATPTAVLFGRVRPGQWLRERGLLRVPVEQRRIGDVAEDLQSGPVLLGETAQGTAFTRAVLDPRVNRVQQACARRGGGGARARRIETLIRRCMAEGPEGFSGQELGLLANDAGALARLHAEAWRAPPDSYWGRALERYVRAHASADAAFA